MFRIIISLACLEDLQIYFWKLCCIGNHQKINVSDLPDAYVSAIKMAAMKKVFLNIGIYVTES